MDIKKEWMAAVLMVMALLVISGSTALAAEKVVYNKYNIHVQDQIDKRGNHRYQASYANYTDPGAGHLIIPAGSPLLVQKVSRKEIVFLSQKDNQKIEFECHEPRMGMSADQYLALITSPEPVSLKKFSKEDRKGIEAGKAEVGMTKEGVMAALGYPAAHKTPSPEANLWYFWTNRFRTIGVEFDDRGKVKRIVR